MDDLYGLLGLSPSTDVDRLRAAYEGAMTAATHRQDWTRARQLSAAFDRLPEAVRFATYSGRDRDAPRWTEDSHGALYGAAGLTRPGQARHVRWTVVLATVAIVVAIIVAIATIGHAVWKHAHDVSAGPPLTAPAVAISTPAPASRPPRSPTTPKGQSAKAAGKTAVRRRATHRIIRAAGDVRFGNTGRQIGGLPAWQVPSTVPLDQRGRATVRCADTFTSTNWIKLDHRVIFTCPIGLAPEFLVINR